jgi:hypothetical protein
MLFSQIQNGRLNYNARSAAYAANRAILPVLWHTPFLLDGTLKSINLPPCQIQFQDIRAT